MEQSDADILKAGLVYEDPALDRILWPDEIRKVWSEVRYILQHSAHPSVRRKGFPALMMTANGCSLEEMGDALSLHREEIHALVAKSRSEIRNAAKYSRSPILKDLAEVYDPN